MYNQPTPFIKCIYDLLNNKSMSSIITWNNDRCSFTILDPHDFENVVLKNYFPELTFKNFCKKLKQYSFNKIKEACKLEFSHSFFQQNKAFLLGKITQHKGIPSRNIIENSNEFENKIRRTESAQLRLQDLAGNLESRFRRLIEFNRNFIDEINKREQNIEFKRLTINAEKIHKMRKQK